MALKVKAREREFKIGQYAGTYRYVMMPELYSQLTTDKVIKEAALRSGVSQGVMQACWDAAGEVIKAWATEGHSVALPGLGTMRFGLSAKSVADVNEVKSSLIKTRRIVFTPNTDLKQELKDTSIVITCYDRDGNEVKRVTSTDDATVEDNGSDTDTDTGENDGQGSGNGSSDSGSGSSDSGQGSGSSGSSDSGSGSGSGSGSSDSGSGSSGSGSGSSDSGSGSGSGSGGSSSGSGGGTPGGDD